MLGNRYLFYFYYQQQDSLYYANRLSVNEGYCMYCCKLRMSATLLNEYGMVWYGMYVLYTHETVAAG